VFGAVFKARESGIVLALVVLVAFTAAQNSRFLSGQSIRDILLGTAILAVLAVGQAIVMITRNIDLSVGSVLGLSAFAVGSLLQHNQGLPVVVALLVGLAVGAVCGLLNGALVRFGQVPALVVTLGTLYAYRGISYPVLRTEGRVTFVDGVLAVAVLAGLLGNATLGWWWADPVAGYVLVFYAVREVRATVTEQH
jgi:ribose/xylose/arabinose/galactoside ABC-type transport system permease subunit